MPKSRRSLLRLPVSVASIRLVLLWTCALSAPLSGQIPEIVPSPHRTGPTKLTGDTAGIIGDRAAEVGPAASIVVAPAGDIAGPAGDTAGELFGPAASAVGSQYFEEVLPGTSDAEWGKQFESIRENDVRIKVLEPAEKLLVPAPDLYELSTEKYKIYRGEESMITFMPGGGDQFGWLSFESTNYLSRKKQSGPMANVNFHLLSGPRSIDLPARLYDFELGYQARNSLSDLFSYEWSAMVGAYSDFEGSAREGVRFPAHAVGMFHPGPRTDWVFGVDYLGRDDVKVLPVAGFCWHDPATPQIRYQMVFPRPRIDFTLSSEVRLYVAGLFGGGTWQIEFPDSSNDVMTYRDYKFVTGIERLREDGSLASWELGWVFGRKLEFRDRSDELSMDDAFVLRYVKRR